MGLERAKPEKLLEILQNTKRPDLKPIEVCKSCGRERALVKNGLCTIGDGNCFDRFNYKKQLPKAFQNFSFDTIEMNRNNAFIVRRARSFANFDRSLYLWGPSGHGKTFILTCTFVDSMTKLKYSKYINVPKLLLIDRLEYETREESELRTVEDLMKYKLLFLDDMGAETLTGRTRELLYLILNNAIESGSQRVFITSNKPLSYFIEHVDDRIASRIAGLCGKENVLKLVDKDRRLL